MAQLRAQSAAVLCCLVLCLPVVSLARTPQWRALRGADIIAELGQASDAFAPLPNAISTSLGNVLELWTAKLSDRLAELGGNVDQLRIVLVGDAETRSLWQSFCSMLGDPDAAATTTPSDPTLPVSCSFGGPALSITFAPVTLCGPLSPASRALLSSFQDAQPQLELPLGAGASDTAGAAASAQQDRTGATTATVVLLGLGAKQALHLGTALPLRCPSAAADFSGSLDALAGDVREALGSTPHALVLLGPAALCAHRLPSELEAAVHAAQAADPARRRAMAAECVASLLQPRTHEGGADVEAGSVAGAWRGSSEAEEAVCGASLLTASAVEELNAQAAGVVRLLRDRWGGRAPALDYVDMHRLTKGQCALAAQAPSSTDPIDAAAQTFPALAAPALLEALSRAAAQLAAARR